MPLNLILLSSSGRYFPKGCVVKFSFFFLLSVVFSFANDEYWKSDLHDCLEPERLFDGTPQTNAERAEYNELRNSYNQDLKEYMACLKAYSEKKAEERRHSKSAERKKEAKREYLITGREFIMSAGHVMDKCDVE